MVDSLIQIMRSSGAGLVIQIVSIAGTENDAPHIKCGRRLRVAFSLAVCKPVPPTGIHQVILCVRETVEVLPYREHIVM